MEVIMTTKEDLLALDISDKDIVCGISASGGAAYVAGALKAAKEKGCKELSFTSGIGRESAQEFYKNKGAEIYDTNFFRKE